MTETVRRVGTYNAEQNTGETDTYHVTPSGGGFLPPGHWKVWGGPDGGIFLLSPEEYADAFETLSESAADAAKGKADDKSASPSAGLPGPVVKEDKPLK